MVEDERGERAEFRESDEGEESMAGKAERR